MRRILPSLSFIIAVTLIAPPGLAAAENRKCDAHLVAKTIDDTASALRNLNSESEKRFQIKLAGVAKKKGWTQDQMRAHAGEALNDEKLTEFNAQIDTLVSQIDGLSATAGAQISCERLDDLQTVRNHLLTVMGEKSGYMLARLDAEMQTAAPAAPAAAPTSIAPPAKVPPKPAARADAKTPPAAGTEKKTAQNWQTAPQPLPPLPQSSPKPLNPPAATAPGTLPPTDANDGYSEQEIRDAGRGMFGMFSADLAANMDHSFKNYGRPTGYITGDEGGGAFLAGLRYGHGELHLKNGGVHKIFWQGPSVGADLGANGAKTMFLVYRLRDASQIYRRFSGVEGTAYIAGGVGVTVLSADNMLIVPIRSGLGLRLGASLAYLKFTERATWNPF
jgi:hypothetical protein